MYILNNVFEGRLIQVECSAHGHAHLLFMPYKISVRPNCSQPITSLIRVSDHVILQWHCTPLVRVPVSHLGNLCTPLHLVAHCQINRLGR